MIRRYAAPDAARCCEIINACLPQLSDMNEAARDYVRAKNVPQRLHAELNEVFTVVFTEDKEVLGLGSLAENEIKRVYVDPAHQTQGVGRELMVALEGEARSRSIDAVMVESRPDAVPFYLSLGYYVLDRGSFVIEGARFSIVRMEKLLSQEIT